MANNYCESSSKLSLENHHIAEARSIVDRMVVELSNGDEEDCGVVATVESDGVWFHADESINPEHVACIAQALLDELKIDEPFTFSWAYTCSKPRIDEFGGGACSVKRGEEPFYVDAMSLAEAHFKEAR